METFETETEQKELTAAEDLEEALRALEERQIFLDAVSKKQRAVILKQMGRTEEAKAVWQELLDQYGDKRAGLSLAAEALEHGEMELVLQYADRILESPAEATVEFYALFYRALAMQSLGKEETGSAMEQALKGFERMEDGSMKTDMLPLKVFLRLQLGQDREALEELDRLKAELPAGENDADTAALLSRIEAMREDIVKRMDSIADR